MLTLPSFQDPATRSISWSSSLNMKRKHHHRRVPISSLNGPDRFFDSRRCLHTLKEQPVTGIVDYYFRSWFKAQTRMYRINYVPRVGKSHDIFFFSPPILQFFESLDRLIVDLSEQILHVTSWQQSIPNVPFCNNPPSHTFRQNRKQ